MEFSQYGFPVVLYNILQEIVQLLLVTYDVK